MEDASIDEYERLIVLIRKIAREEAWQALDEHLSDYAHDERTEEAESQCEE